MGSLRKYCACVAFLVAAAGLSPARAQTREFEEADGQDHAVIAYVGAVMTTVVYLPVKVVYAGLGGLIGGLAYLVSAGDAEAFFDVWRVTGEGTYLVTPSMLEGKEPVRLLGP